MAHVLFKQDDALLAEVVCDLFRRRRHRVRVVDGAAGIRCALRHEPFDVAILDVAAPDGSAIALLRAIRADPAIAATPLVVLSACRQHDAIVETLRTGAADYVTKPFVLDDLLGRVEAIVARFGRAGDDGTADRADRARRARAAGFSPWAAY